MVVFIIMRKSKSTDYHLQILDRAIYAEEIFNHLLYSKDGKSLFTPDCNQTFVAAISSHHRYEGANAERKNAKEEGKKDSKKEDDDDLEVKVMNCILGMIDFVDGDAGKPAVSAEIRKLQKLSENQNGERGGRNKRLRDSDGGFNDDGEDGEQKIYQRLHRKDDGMTTIELIHLHFQSVRIQSKQFDCIEALTLKVKKLHLGVMLTMAGIEQFLRNNHEIIIDVDIRSCARTISRFVFKHAGYLSIARMKAVCCGNRNIETWRERDDDVEDEEGDTVLNNQRNNVSKDKDSEDGRGEEAKNIFDSSVVGRWEKKTTRFTLRSFIAAVNKLSRGHRKMLRHFLISECQVSLVSVYFITTIVN